LVKNLKRIEKAWFPISQFSRIAGFGNLKSTNNPRSTIKFREALECFGRACSPMSPEQSDQELLLRNEYLAAENRILSGQIKDRLLLSEGDNATLAEIAHRLVERLCPPRYDNHR
jgi:hypothetical protein